VAQHHDERCPKPFCGKLDAPDLRGRDDISGNADNKQVAQALIEHDLCWHARVGTSENNGEGLLAIRQFAPASLVRESVAALGAGHEPTVPLSQPFKCCAR
jgi:hypothetical protein